MKRNTCRTPDPMCKWDEELKRRVKEKQKLHPDRTACVTFCLADPVFTKCCDEHDKWIDSHFRYTKGNNVLHLLMRYDYEVDLDRCTNFTQLLWWTHHLMGKNWFDTEHAMEFIERVCSIKGWKMYEGQG